MHGEIEVLVKTRLASILHAYHDNPTTGAHLGRDKTCAKIGERYYWYGMKDTITKYIKKCKTCFAVNPKVTKESAPLKSIPVPTKQWSLVGIDLIGPLQETPSGNTYIVAITDHFTKWSEAAGIPDKSAVSVAKFIYNVVCRFGCMDTLISDQGKEFLNEINENLLKRFQTEHRITSAYHPQTNGQRERDNRTLKDALNKLSNERGDDWDENIAGVLFAYHTSVHASTKRTPFELMMGRKAKLPLDPKTPVDITEAFSQEFFEGINQESLQNLAEIQQSLHNITAEKIQVAQKRQKYYYDLRRDKSKTFSEGAVVYMKNPRQQGRKGDKMKPRFLGSYTVVTCFENGCVKLMNGKGQILKNAVNTSNLKLYADGNENDPTDDPLPADNLTSELSTHGLPTDDGLNVKIEGDELKADVLIIDEQPTAICSSQDIIVLSKDARTSSMVTQNMKRTFKPLPGNIRQKLAVKFGLQSKKNLRFYKAGSLDEPRKTYKTIGDGNCFFRCVIYILTGAEDDHLIIRDIVTKHMLEIGTKLKEYLDCSPHEYLKQTDMNKDRTWATDAEIMATANLLGCDIFIYSMNGDHMAWMNHPASFSLQKTTNSALYIENVNNHYNVVISV